MNTRTVIRRARAVATMYLAAYIDAEIAYRGHSDKAGNVERLEVVSAYRDALDTLVSEIGNWQGYPSLRKGTTLGGAICESGVGLTIDGRDAWRAAVGADVDARIADPKGTRGAPLPWPEGIVRRS